MLDAFTPKKMIQHFISPRSVKNANGVVYLEMDDGFYKMDASLKAVPCPPPDKSSPYEEINIERCTSQPQSSCTSVKNIEAFTIKIAHTLFSTNVKSQPSADGDPDTSSGENSLETSTTTEEPQTFAPAVTENEQQERLFYCCQSPAHPNSPAVFLTAKGRSQHIQYHVQRGETYSLSEQTDSPNSDSLEVTNGDVAAPIKGKSCSVQMLKTERGNCIQITSWGRTRKFPQADGTTWPEVNGIMGTTIAMARDKIFFSVLPPENEAEIWVVDLVKNQAAELRLLATACSLSWTIVRGTTADLLFMLSTNGVLRKCVEPEKLGAVISGPEMDAVFAVPPILIPYSSNSLHEPPILIAEAIDSDSSVILKWKARSSLLVELQIVAPTAVTT
ncbi:hypothetical protein DFJ73DRAFT_839156 [Zopfochytrium polystomum]|nr:hypothetical protein DFJ73DRAFT_839156 [Zopfochytrium polystomum]